VVIAMSASLGACGGGPGGPSGSGWFSGGLPFDFGGSPSMNLAPIIGAPQKISDELSQDLVTVAKDRNLKLSAGNSSADYTVRGYLVASPERRGSKISYIWDVTDAQGQRVHRVSGDEMVASRSGSDPWSGVDSTTIRKIADKTTSELAAGVPGGRPASSGTQSPGPGGTPGATPTAASPSAAAPATQTAAAPVNPREVLALVPPVSGAPGDGQNSLPAALKKRLQAGGVKLASANARNVYTVKGSVKMGNAAGGKQSIRIDWQVIDPNGRQLGTVSQENTIPKGSLDGQWGHIADAAAGSAADGIIKLLPKPST
jgi:hypothetical protein